MTRRVGGSAKSRGKGKVKAKSESKDGSEGESESGDYPGVRKKQILLDSDDAISLPDEGENPCVIHISEVPYLEPTPPPAPLSAPIEYV